MVGRSVTASTHSVDKAQKRDIIFSNVPSFAHLPERSRAKARQLHHAWEADLAAQPLVVLHRSLAREFKELPRQTVCWLIAHYCTKMHVSYDTLKYSIVRSNGDLNTPGLVITRQFDGVEIFNLHKLNDDTLWRVYCEIPEEHRPRRPPPSSPKRRKQEQTGLPVAQHTNLEELVVWACCDKCDKWRRLFNTAQEDVSQPWFCSMHPDELTCEDPEEQMDNEEKWSGLTDGYKCDIAADHGDVPNADSGSDEEPTALQASCEQQAAPESDCASDMGDLFGTGDNN